MVNSDIFIPLVIIPLVFLIVFVDANFAPGRAGR